MIVKKWLSQRTGPMDLPLLLPALIVVYTLLFEWRGVFELPNLSFAGNLLKVAIPVFCLAFVLTLKPSFGNTGLKRYFQFFLLFCACGLLSCILSSDPREAFTQWCKYLPRFIFFSFIGLYLIKNGKMSATLMKCFVAIAVLTVIQYIFLEIADFNGLAGSFVLPTPRGYVYHGPYGILGQGWARMPFNNISFFRLYGFWLEPSTASGFLLSSAFFSEALYLRTKLSRWRTAAIMCFLGGAIATFSNTGYLIVGLTGLLEEIFLVKTGKHASGHLWKLAFFICVIGTALFGRMVVSRYYADNKDLRYLIGVRESVQDPYGGRFAAVRANLEALTASPLTVLFGVGFKIPVKDSPYSSASAPLLWLVFTGVTGLLVLALREWQLVAEIGKHFFSSVYALRISQAWLAAFISNLIYGDLMTPFYLITVVIVFSSLYANGLDAGKVTAAPAI